MLQSLLNIFKVPDLRRKLGFTVMLIMVYRIGAHVPCPFVDLAKVSAFASESSQTGLGALFGMVDMFTGQAFKQMTIFALGIMPYITASIILQLLTVVWPYLEKIAKEGEAGRKKINQFTRYGTVMLAAFQSIGLGLMMLRMDMKMDGVATPLFLFSTMVAMTTGTCFIMWLGEKITEYGIGNGISIIIAVGIMASYYNSIQAMRIGVRTDSLANIWVVAIPVIYVGVTMLIILMQQASRRIPIQYARRMVGRREMQGGGNFLPLKLNTAGVIPVIFSSSILMFPGLLLSAFTGGAEERGLAVTLQQMFAPQTDLYNLYALFGLDNWGGLFRIFEMGNLYNFL
ncbi:MAG: preprotein translocase subunit SecY, partial [Candidatus Sumerlaeota bacterium]